MKDQGLENLYQSKRIIHFSDKKWEDDDEWVSKIRVTELCAELTLPCNFFCFHDKSLLSTFGIIICSCHKGIRKYFHKLNHFFMIYI
jgi:hypothetical protein